jgi:hypothetical protein
VISGLSFLPYAAPGATYTTQVFDSSQNVGTANVLAYNTVPKQSLLPSVFYEVPATIAFQQVPSSVSVSASANQYKGLTGVAPVAVSNTSAASYKSSSQTFTSVASNTAINNLAVPVVAAVSNASSICKPHVSVSKQAQPQFSLDLFDCEGLITEHLLSSQVREHQAQSQNTVVLQHNQQPVQLQVADVRHQQAQPSHVNSVVVNQQIVQPSASQQAVVNYSLERVKQVAASNNVFTNSRNQTVINSVRDARSQAMQMHNITRMPIVVQNGVQEQKNQVVSNLLPVELTSVQPGVNRAVESLSHQTSQSLESHSQPILLSQPNIDKNMAFWSYIDGLPLAISDDQRAALENTRLSSAFSGINCAGLVEPHDAVVEPVIYEAVSPAAAAAAAGNTDPLAYNFLDSLQLGNLFGSTVDTSALFSVQTTQEMAVEATKSSVSELHGNGQLCNVDEGKSNPVRDVLAEAVSQAFSGDKLPSDESDKGIRPKPNLGIVLPLSHGRDVNRAPAVVPVTPKAGVNNLEISATSLDCSSSVSSTSEQPSFEKLALPTSDGHSSAAGGGGIVLTNITGNVYVNQYTMLPGGTQAVDNALLHTDLTLFPATGSLVSHNDSLLLEDEASYKQQAAPARQAAKISVVLPANEADDELGHLAVDPVTGTRDDSTAPARIAARVPVSQPRKSTDNVFFGSDATPLMTAKPSNEFESCFLKFLCGHKAETLSSVLNSPIRARPELPKYIPEVRRSRSSTVSETSANTSDVEIVEPLDTSKGEVDKAIDNETNGEGAVVNQVFVCC